MSERFAFSYASTAIRDRSGMFLFSAHPFSVNHSSFVSLQHAPLTLFRQFRFSASSLVVDVSWHFPSVINRDENCLFLRYELCFLLVLKSMYLTFASSAFPPFPSRVSLIHVSKTTRHGTARAFERNWSSVEYR